MKKSKDEEVVKLFREDVEKLAYIKENIVNLIIT